MCRLLKYFFLIFIFFFFKTNVVLSEENNYFTSGGNYKSHRFSELDKINIQNIKNLDIAWIFKHDLESKNDPTAANALTPILAKDSLIFASVDGNLISLNPSTGKLNWKRKYNGHKNLAKRGLVFQKIKHNNTYKDVVFVPTDSTVLTVSPEDGKIIYDLGDEGKVGKNGTGLAPIIADNNIYISSGSTIKSYNLENYFKNWEINLNGARVWSGFSYDRSTKSLIVTTSDPADLIYSRTKIPDYTNSMVVIDANKGNIKCSFQDIKYDHWDLDMVGHPIVIKQKIEKDFVNTVFGLSKTGNIIAINLDNCEYLYQDSFEYIKVPQPDNSIKNVNYSDKQKFFKKPTPLSSIIYDFKDYLNSVKDGDKRDYITHKTRYAKYNDVYIPLSLNYDVIFIGLHGGPQWPGGAFDKVNRQIIVPTNHDPWIIRVYYENQVYRIKRGINVRIKKFIDKHKFLSSYKKKAFLDKDFNSRIIKHVDNTDFHSSYKILKILYDIIDSSYFTLTRPLHLKGSTIYKNKCMSCHGHYGQGYSETEFTGDKYIPSLTNISQLDRFSSIKDNKNFYFSHKYIDQKIEITPKELKEIGDYFKNHDKFLNKLGLTHIAYKWQILLDKDNLPASNNPWGKITAFDIDSGRINWSINSGETIKDDIKIPGSTNFGGLLTTASNILFATGTSDEKLYAYDAKNGSKIWSYKLPISGSAPPMTYLSGEDQYVVVNASGGRYYNYRKADTEYLIAFKLKKN